MKNSLVQRVQRLESVTLHEDNFQDIRAEILAHPWYQDWYVNLTTATIPRPANVAGSFQAVAMPKQAGLSTGPK